MSQVVGLGMCNFGGGDLGEWMLTTGVGLSGDLGKANKGLGLRGFGGVFRGLALAGSCAGGFFKDGFRRVVLKESLVLS